MGERCVHCLATVDQVSEDHWFPRSWYPTTTPLGLEKWAFPSCVPCNTRLGNVEDRLRHRLALALDPRAAEAQGIVESAHRSFDPQAAASARDVRARTSRRDALQRDLLRGDQVPASAVLPGLGGTPGLPLEEQVATLVSATDVHQFAEKLVRGLAYLQLARYIETTHTIDVQLREPADAKPFTDALDRFGDVLARGPGIRARVARANSDPLSALHEFVIWQRLTIFAIVEQAEAGSAPGAGALQVPPA